jgi:hypothetical protein
MKAKTLYIHGLASFKLSRLVKTEATFVTNKKNQTTFVTNKKNQTTFVIVFALQEKDKQSFAGSNFLDKTIICSFVRSFVRLFVCLFIRSFVFSFVCLFIRSFVRSFFRSLFSKSPA